MITHIIYKLKKNNFLYFLNKFFLFFLIVLIFDLSIGKILRYFYFRQNFGPLYNTTYSLEDTKADILIFGSSRANHHYSPEIFEEKFQLSCYNVGRDGSFIFYHYAILRSVLKRYKPKIIVLDFVHDEFVQNQDSYDRISSLLPYYKTHPEIRSIVELRSSYERIKLFSTVYPFNSLIYTIISKNLEYKKDKVEQNGYIPIKTVWNGKVKEYRPNNNNFKLDSVKIKMFESFVQDCIKSNIKLYIICSPYLFNNLEKSSSIALGQTIAQNNNIRFLDYSSDTIFTNNPQLFADFGHLNEDGAKVFTNLVINQIK